MRLTVVIMLDENWTLNAPQRHVADLTDSGDNAAMRPSFDSSVGSAVAVSSCGLNSDILRFEMVGGELQKRCNESIMKGSWVISYTALLSMLHKIFGDAIQQYCICHHSFC